MDITAEQLQAAGFTLKSWGSLVLASRRGNDDRGAYGLHVTLYPNGRISGKRVRSIGDITPLTLDELVELL